MLEDIIKSLEVKITDLFKKDSSGHDIYHLKRTMNLALKLQETEGGDRIVIGIAAFLHDIHRILSIEYGRYCTPKESLSAVTNLLEGIDITIEQKNKVLHSIEFHEEYSFGRNGITVSDIETLILQDADNLDNIGAIGIARALTYGGAHKMNIWLPKIPFERKVYDEDTDDISTIHHFYNKMLRLKDNMNTETARNIALKRHEFIETYLNEFFDEWNGIK
jgi:uncharacterized protein